MFVTLRYGRNEGDEVQCVEQTTKPPHQGKTSPHLACVDCRAKKVYNLKIMSCTFVQ